MVMFDMSTYFRLSHPWNMRCIITPPVEVKPALSSKVLDLVTKPGLLRITVSKLEQPLNMSTMS